MPKTTADLMSRQFLAFSADTPLGEVLSNMVESDASCAFVIDGDSRPRGIVTERDVLRHFGKDGGRSTAVAALAGPAQAIALETPLAEAVARMREWRARHLAVVDADGRLSGFLDEHELFAGLHSDIASLKESQTQLEHLAFYDALTRLPNRRLLRDRLQLALAHAARDDSLLAVGYLDLDEFKPVNDNFGHAAGDRLLIEVAQRLRDCVRADDTLSRLGGDEFAVLLGGLANIEECERTLDRILKAIAAPFEIAGHEIRVSASIGVTIYPFDGADSDALLRHADHAMYAAKQGGRNRYTLFDTEHNRRALARREANQRIEAALANGEFLLHYQPKVDMRRGRVVGAEALIRWLHPEKGLLLPADFLPATEETDLAVSLGHWVLGEALRQMSEWAASDLTLPVSVNISPHHLHQADFVARLAALLASHPAVDPAWLELEILENTALDNIPLASGVIEECRRLGVYFALDDFGTGYSSLTFFRRLPARTLKIDQSFVRDMLDDPEDMAIVEGVIGLTQAFGRQAIAEGVESSEHGMLLMQLGCDLAQGYGIARPMPAALIPDWLRNFRPDPLWAGSGAFRWPREDLPMLSVELEHKRWVERLAATLAAEAGTTFSGNLDVRGCRFGLWYYGPGQDLHGGMPAFRELEPIHARIHALARELLSLHATDPEAARARLPELFGHRDLLLEKLKYMETELILGICSLADAKPAEDGPQ